MKNKFLISMILICNCILFVSGIQIGYADSSSFSDIDGHWAKASIEKAVDDGILKGFDDGTIKPDDKITEAQMITIISRVLNLTEQADLSTYKVISGSWYEKDLSKAVALGIIDLEDIYRADSNMTRKDAFVMISNAFQLSFADPDMTKSSQYADFFTLNDSEKRIFASLINLGYVKGWDGNIQLNSDVTRAEFVTLLYRIIGEYIDGSTLNNLNITDNSMISGKSFSINDKNINSSVWLSSEISNVNIVDSNIKNLYIRSNNINSFSIDNSEIERLVMASGSGDIELNGSGIDSIVIGDGNGLISLNPAGNSVEVTGKGRKINLNGKAEDVIISGNYNNIYLSSLTYTDSVKISGIGNKVIIDSYVNNLIVDGKNNIITGQGTAYNLTMNSDSSDIEIHSDIISKEKIKNEVDLSGYIEAPKEVNIGNYLNLSLNLNNIPVGRTVKITWYKDEKEIDSKSIILTKNAKPEFSYYIDYSYNVESYCEVYCEIDYLANDGSAKKIVIPKVKININKGLAYLLEKIKCEYSGDNTTQWAINNNLSDSDKERYVNESGYSSDSEYLIWINIGTQYATVYKGSEGKWSLLRSFLVSTGKNQSTPIGIYKTSYKQSYITTNEYTITPIVFINKDSLSLQSRLYYPETIQLKSDNNGIGYPETNGDIRMNSENIQWIYDNVSNGTTVVIY